MRWTHIVALGAVASIGLTACGGASPKPGTSGNGSGAASTAVQQAGSGLMPDAPAPKAEVQGAKKGGILTVEYASQPESLDPSQQFYQDTERMLHLTSRSLTAFTMMDGKSVLVPDLATDLGKKSEDGLSWTFTLRDGLKYSDGSPVKAEDVVYAIKRSFAHKEFSGGPTYQDEYFKGGDKYKGPWQSKDTDFQAAEAKDDKTVVIHLAKKMESLPYFVSFSQFSPIPKAKDTKEQYQYNMLATGPYKIKKFTQGTDLTLEKNDQWDPKTDPARTQYVDGYHFVFGVDDTKSQTAVLASNGTAATTLNWDAIDASLVSKVQSASKDQFATGPGACTIAINMDTRKIPLEVRKAIAVAYPFDQQFKAAQMSSLTATRTSTLMMPQVPGHLDFTVDGIPAGKGTGDPDKAKQMLQAAGKTGFELVYYFAEDNPIAARADQVRKEALEKAGFKVTNKGVPNKAFRKLRQDPTGPHNMLQSPAGWCYDWPSGDAVFQSTVTSNVVKSGTSGWGNLQDPKVDAEVKRISELPLAQAGPEWGKFDKWLLETYLPAIPWYNDKGNVVFGTKVHNVVIDPNKGMPALDGVWLDS